jgi:dTDP-4-dehydrorhamnose reductase
MSGKTVVLGKGYIAEKVLKNIDAANPDIHIAGLADTQDQILRLNPDTIINCIGYAGDNNVDDCEIKKDKTLTANVFVPLILAEIALRHGIKLIHISSGCIYHYDHLKDAPIDEDKIPDFFELYYSRTKIYSEQILKILSEKYPILIIRMRVPLDSEPHRRNILTKLIEYKKVIDLPNSVIYIPDFIKALNHLMKINATGIYNVVNRTPLRYPEILEVYKRYRPDFRYELIDFHTLNLTRTNAVLSTQKLENSGFKIRDIHEVLEECVQNYVRYL